MSERAVVSSRMEGSRLRRLSRNGCRWRGIVSVPGHDDDLEILIVRRVDRIACNRWRNLVLIPDMAVASIAVGKDSLLRNRLHANPDAPVS